MLLAELGRGTLERDEVIALSFLSAAAGESIFLLGLPGVAKSMIARRLSLAFKDARRFEYLMSRFSTPDEIFGPVSISKLKDSDTYERVVDGYLPTADVAFLDEIWKAGPAIQNSLLTALNEKIFRNGREDLRLPLKAIIAASNELPAQGEGLEALWDRFLVRYIVEPIKDKNNFMMLLEGGTSEECRITPDMQFSGEEMENLLKSRERIGIPPKIMEFLYTMRSKYAIRAQEALKDRTAATTAAKGTCKAPDIDEEDNVPYVSDRRWKKIVGILRTSALLNGRESVDWSDCLLLEHLLWDNDTQTGMIRDDIAKELVAILMKDSAADTDESIWKKKPEGLGGVRSFWSPDSGKHYAFEAGGELMLISVEDFNRLGTARLYGRFSRDNVVEVTDEPAEFTIRSTKPGTVTINNFTYPLKLDGVTPANVGGFLNAVISSSRDNIQALHNMVDDNMFTRSFSSYRTLGREVRRYQGRMETVSKSI